MTERINKLDVIEKTLEELEAKKILVYRQVREELIEERNMYIFRVAPYKKTTDINKLNEFIAGVRHEIGINMKLTPFKIKDNSSRDITTIYIGELITGETYGKKTITTKYEYFFNPNHNTEDAQGQEYHRSITLFIYNDQKRMEQIPDNAFEEISFEIKKE